jgi:hypothetical protein
MALLAFENHDSSPVASLLDPSQRHKTASEVNAAILSAQNQEKGMLLCISSGQSTLGLRCGV